MFSANSPSRAAGQELLLPLVAPDVDTDPRAARMDRKQGSRAGASPSHPCLPGVLLAPAPASLDLSLASGRNARAEALALAAHLAKPRTGAMVLLPVALSIARDGLPTLAVSSLAMRVRIAQRCLPSHGAIVVVVERRSLPSPPRAASSSPCCLLRNAATTETRQSCREPAAIISSARFAAIVGRRLNPPPPRASSH